MWIAYTPNESDILYMILMLSIVLAVVSTMILIMLSIKISKMKHRTINMLQLVNLQKELIKRLKRKDI